MERLTDPVTYRPQDQETQIPKTENERQLNRRDRRTDMNFSDSEAGNGGPARASERASAAGYVSSARSRATEAHSENKSRESAIITRQTVIGPIGRCGGAARSAGEGLGWGCWGGCSPLRLREGFGAGAAGALLGAVLMLFLGRVRSAY